MHHIFWSLSHSYMMRLALFAATIKKIPCRIYYWFYIRFTPSHTFHIYTSHIRTRAHLSLSLSQIYTHIHPLRNTCTPVLVFLPFHTHSFLPTLQHTRIYTTRHMPLPPPLYTSTNKNITGSSFSFRSGPIHTSLLIIPTPPYVTP